MEQNNKVQIEFSFDDGYSNDTRTAEILEKYNLRGTFYIIFDAVGQPNRLSWDQIKDLDKRGHSIGSHTMTHPSDLKALFNDELHVEIQNSKDLIENVLGHNITSFCYPRGRFDERVKQIVAESGYITARGTGKPGKTTVEDRLALPGTVHLYPRQEYEGVPVLEYAKGVIDKVQKFGGYCNVWGHGNELEKYSLWEVLEEICQYVTRN